MLADFSNGDARIALNNLEMVLQSKLSTVPKDGGKLHITVQQIKNGNFSFLGHRVSVCAKIK